MEQNMMASGGMINETAKEHSLGWMGLIMKEILEMIRCTERALSCGRANPAMLASGDITRKMVKEK